MGGIDLGCAGQPPGREEHLPGLKLVGRQSAESHGRGLVQCCRATNGRPRRPANRPSCSSCGVARWPKSLNAWLKRCVLFKPEKSSSTFQSFI